MGKRILLWLVAAIGVLVMCSPILASTIGEPVATLKKGQARVELDFSFVHSTLKIDDELPSELDTTAADESDYDSHRIIFRGSYGVIDALETFAKIGFVNLDLENGFLNQGEMQGGDTLAAGGGFKLTLWERQEWAVGIVAQTLWYKTHEAEDSFTADIAHRPRQVNQELQFEIWETEFAAGTSYRKDIDTIPGHTSYRLIPYTGVFVSFLHGAEESDVFVAPEGILPAISSSYELDAEPEDRVGLFAGTIFTDVPGEITVGIEGRFFSETSISIWAGYRF